MSDEVREWLERLARRDDKVRAYMNIYRGLYPREEMPPAALVAIIELLIEDKERIQKAYVDYSMRHIDPPILIVDKGQLGHLSLRPGDNAVVGEPGTVISADEWPKTERTVIELSEVVYLWDFFRSFWRRLRRRR